MTTRVSDVQVKVGADFAGYELANKSATASAAAFERELAKVEARQIQMAKAEATAYRDEAARNTKREADMRTLAGMQIQAAAEEAARNQKRGESIGKVGTAFMAAGAVIGIGIGLAAKAAIDWEQSFAGVEKVVVGSLDGMTAAAKQATLGGLSQQLRDLSKTIPATAEDIAKVAQSAGQLGVAIPDLAKFTQTAEALGATTSMSADDAATGLAKLGNVMGVLPKDVDRAGSALLALGNYGASTEQEILDMSVRIAGAGKVVGLTEPQVMGFANALTSVGINAEEGGSAISRVFIKMATSVKEGGKELDGFARVSGMSAADFKAAFGADAAGTMTTFLGGLHAINTQGGDTFGTLDKLGLSEIRVRDTLLRASAASDLLTSSLALGTKAWSDNNALLEAAAVKYDTAGSRLQIARNNINDAAITIGETFLPILAGAADKVAVLAQAFEGLPAPAKSALGVIGALGASALLFGGAALSLVPKVAGLLKTLDEIGGTAGKAATALRGAGSVLAGPWGIALAAGTIALGYWINKQAEAKQKVDELKGTLDAQTGAVTTNSRAWTANQLQQDGTLAAARKLGLDLATVTDAALGNADAIGRVNAALEAQGPLYDAIKNGTAGLRLGETGNAIKQVSDAVNGNNASLTEAQRQWKDTHDAMGAAGAQADSTGASTSGLKGKVDDLSGGLQTVQQKLDDFTKALKGLYDQEFAVSSAQDSFDKAINDMAIAQENAATSTTKATAADKAAAKVAGDKAKAAAIAAGDTKAHAAAVGKAAHDQYLANVTHTQSAADLANAQIAVRDSMRGIVQDGYNVIEAMAQQGASSDEMTAKAKELAAKIAEVGAKANLSKTDIDKYRNAMLDVPAAVATAFTTPGLTAAVDALGSLLTRMALINGQKVAIQVDSSAANVRESRTPKGIVQPTTPVPVGIRLSPRNQSAGAILHYADGGEDHTAQIATGTQRIWNEPETMGEAYIPLAPSKRARSQAILGDVAHRFGGQVSYGSGSHVQVVKVPIQQNHTTLAPINVGSIVTESPAAFVDWSQQQRAFSSARQQ